MTPEREIFNALELDNPQSLAKVLPKIRTSTRHDELIELVLYETASKDYFTSYKLIAEHVFRYTVDLRGSMRIPPAIRASIRKGHVAIAEDLVTRILVLPHLEPRRFLLVCAFHCAVEAGNMRIVARILDEDLAYPELQKAMRVAAESCKLEVVSLLLDDLLEDDKARDRVIGGKAETEEEIERAVRASQAHCLMVGLCSAIRGKAHEVAAFLLLPYVECLEKINPVSHDQFKKTEIFTGIEDDVYLLLGREECRKLFTKGLPMFAGNQIARCANSILSAVKLEALCLAALALRIELPKD
ncbi:hypothetical protein BJX64DRAFT_285798 [Aspergillus heterothallicus]